ncbi:MAG: hypothetical protein ABJB03_04885 [Rhodoglobus sp.]
MTDLEQTTQRQAKPNRGWLRRNLLPLIALVAIIPAITWVVYGIPHQEDVDTAVTTPVVAQGQAVDVGGYSIVLSNSKEFVGTGLNENKIPLGLSLVAAIIDITPQDGAGEFSCTVSLVAPDGTDDLRWPEVFDPAKYGYGVRDGSDTNCYFDDETGSLEVVFLTPKGAYANAVVEVSVTQDSALVRLALKH